MSSGNIFHEPEANMRHKYLHIIKPDCVLEINQVINRNLTSPVQQECPWNCVFIWNGCSGLWFNVSDSWGSVCCIVIPHQHHQDTVDPKKYAHGFCFAVLCCDYTLTDFPISIRLTSLALWQSNDCPSASKATLMNMDKYFMWIHYKRLHNHNKAKHNKTVCTFLGIYRMSYMRGEILIYWQLIGMWGECLISTQK